MTAPRGGTRAATRDDGPHLLSLWTSMYAAAGDREPESWQAPALEWFGRLVDEPRAACFPVVEVEDTIVATAIGTLEIGVPNPHCLRGRGVRLANVVTLPRYRGRGFATLVVHEVIAWARSVDADRVDLSATPAARRIYEKAGFVLTSAPRMKLAL